MVGIRPVRTRSDDDECDLRMPFGHNRFSNICGYLGFGTSRFQKARYPRVHSVDRRAGLVQRLDLGGILDHPQRAQDVGGQSRDLTEDLGKR